MDKRKTLDLLIIWERSSADGESMLADLLPIDRFTDIDPTHPFGGPDGKKDILCKRDGLTHLCACTFTNGGNESFTEIKKKFKKDLAGRQRHQADGFVFATNNHLPDSERQELEQIASDDGAQVVEVYHRLRLRVLLDSPKGLAARARYLGIEMSMEEQVAHFEAMRADASERRTELREVVREAFTDPQVVQGFFDAIEPHVSKSFVALIEGLAAKKEGEE